MNLFRTIGAWVFWLIGDIAFKIMCLFPASIKWIQFWYLIFNFFMLLSASTQRFARGPWSNNLGD